MIDYEMWKEVQKCNGKLEKLLCINKYELKKRKVLDAETIV